MTTKAFLTNSSLTKVAGLSLIKRTILLAKQAGITQFVICLTTSKEKVIKDIKPDELQVNIQFVDHPDSQKQEIILRPEVIGDALSLQINKKDIHPIFSQPIQTKKDIKKVEKIFLNQCRKETDGFISKNINRHLSLFVSSFLMKTNLSANQITGLNTFIGLLSAYFVALGSYASLALGGFLFNLASILDGCDGELSKLKMTSSKLGQWLDTAADNITFFAFLIGVILGMANLGDPHIAITGSLTIFGVVMSLTVMIIYLLRNTNSGSLVAIHTDFQKNEDPSFFKKVFNPLRFMARRDFFATLFFVLALFNQRQIILWAMMIGTNLTWIVLLKTKLITTKAQYDLSTSRPSD